MNRLNKAKSKIHITAFIFKAQLLKTKTVGSLSLQEHESKILLAKHF